MVIIPDAPAWVAAQIVVIAVIMVPMVAATDVPVVDAAVAAAEINPPASNRHEIPLVHKSR